MEWKWLYGLHNGRLDSEVDSEQRDKNLLCLMSGAPRVWATWQYEAHLLAFLCFCCLKPQVILK